MFYDKPPQILRKYMGRKNQICNVMPIKKRKIRFKILRFMKLALSFAYACIKQNGKRAERQLKLNISYFRESFILRPANIPNKPRLNRPRVPGSGTAW